jgi:hypothetical protein
LPPFISKDASPRIDLKGKTVTEGGYGRVRKDEDVIRTDGTASTIESSKVIGYNEGINKLEITQILNFQ